MSLAKHRVLLLFVLLALAVVFTVSGCDQNEKQSQTGLQTKPKIVFGACSWDSIQVHNRIAAYKLDLIVRMGLPSRIGGNEWKIRVRS